MFARRIALIIVALLSLPLFAQSFSISPAAGPTAGGTEVTISGDFPSFAYGVIFGGANATNIRKLDAHTLVAVTPQHLPGVANVEIFELGRFLITGLTFTYVGEIPANLERVLLPILVPPITGQFGSQFITAFTAQLQAGEQVTLYGLDFACKFICPPQFFNDLPIGLAPEGPRIDEADIRMSGTPGRFIYVPKEQLPNVAMNLRVYDRSRSTQNFGTEMPVVRESRFTEGFSSITLLNVPTDPKFRNTLRIYGTGIAEVNVSIRPATGTALNYSMDLSEPKSIFEPAFASFTNFPSNVGPVTVTIVIPVPPILPIQPPRIWAFDSVTNNDTQLITTISPQP
jgi:hypothetical protein